MTDARQSTILIVDDQPENLLVLSEVLQSDFSVRAARSGEQAIRVAASEPRPDLILLDVMMPALDGYAVLANLRENPVTTDIPVIFITALSDDEDEERGLKVGAVDYIAKPIKPAIVLARVRAHVELKRARDILADQNAHLEALVAERTRELDRALRQIEEAHARLKKTHFGTLVAIGELASMRGGDIAEYSRRVADRARQLALKLGLDEREIEDIFVAALLHHAGMIAFPDGMLTKPVSSLNRDELSIYRRHPAVGAGVIARIDALGEIARLIRHHHEHFDGSGFPDRLSGLDIPIGARIIGAISDYENLKTGALTQQPMSAKQACEYLLAERGKRYDPTVVDVLEPMLSAEGTFTIDELQITAKHLQEGMVLTRDVLHPNGFVLLSRGTRMIRRLIDQLVTVEKQLGSPLRIHVHRVQGQKPQAEEAAALGPSGPSFRWGQPAAAAADKRSA
jgi:putative two-component system response regulator